MKQSAFKNLIFWSYFIATFLISQLASLHFVLSFLKPLLGEMFFWLLGALVGGQILKLDQIFYVYFFQPQAQLSLQAKELIRQRRFAEAWDVLDRRIEEQRLTSHSFLFQLIWVVLAFFALTSTGAAFGRTLVMAIGLYLLLDEWEDILAGRNISWLFWQVKREVSLQEQKRFLWVMTGAFAFLTLLLI